jgi:hypothetical protein
MRVIATTVIRHSVLGEDVHGRTFDVDFTNKKVRKVLPTPDPMNIHSNPNPRGGTRGGRGIQVRDGTIYVSNHDTIFSYDMNMKLKGKISHPLTAGIHEIHLVRDGIWVAATDIDSIVKVDLDGNLLEKWCFHQDAGLCGELGFSDPPTPDWEVDHRLKKDETLDRGHLNGIVPENGKLVISLGLLRPNLRVRAEKDTGGPTPKKGLLAGLKKTVKSTRVFKMKKLKEVTTEGVVIDLYPETKKARVVYRNPAIVPDHDGHPWDADTLLFNKTGLCDMYIIDRGSGEVRREVRLPGNWLRGMDRVDDRRVMVGTGPAALHTVDVKTGKVLESMELSKDPNESVHGICVIGEG